MRLQPRIETGLHFVARRTGQLLVGDDAHARLERLLGGNDAADRLPLPADHAVGRQYELVVLGLRDAPGASVDLAGQRLLRGAGERLRLRARGGRVGREGEAVEAAEL